MDADIQNDKAVPPASEAEHIEEPGNLTYESADEEPELHFRTYVAVSAMFVYNFVQLAALIFPSSLVSDCSMLVPLRGKRLTSRSFAAVLDWTWRQRWDE